MRVEQVLGVVQAPRESPADRRTRQRVEIPAQYQWSPAIRMAEPLLAEQRVDLREALGPRKSKMRIDHL